MPLPHMLWLTILKLICYYLDQLQGSLQPDSRITTHHLHLLTSQSQCAGGYMSTCEVGVQVKTQLMYVVCCIESLCSLRLSLSTTVWTVTTASRDFCVGGDKVSKRPCWCSALVFSHRFHLFLAFPVNLYSISSNVSKFVFSFSYSFSYFHLSSVIS